MDNTEGGFASFSSMALLLSDHRDSSLSHTTLEAQAQERARQERLKKRDGFVFSILSGHLLAVETCELNKRLYGNLILTIGKRGPARNLLR